MILILIKNFKNNPLFSGLFFLWNQIKLNCLTLITFLFITQTVNAAENNLSQQKSTYTQINILIKNIQAQHFKTSDAKIAYIAEQLTNIPYGYSNIMGEGNGHSHPAPIYRLDKMNCQTLAQTILALTYATNLKTFNQLIQQISYGALNNSRYDRVHYFNRNHFIESDFNRVNEMNGLLKDITFSPPLTPYATTISFLLDRKQWFLKQAMSLPASVTQQFLKPQPIKLSYLPKYKIILKDDLGNFHPNEDVFKNLATPAIIEIVHDPQQWLIDGKNIKDIIGTDIAIAHLGIIYKQSFHHHELIYYKISCDQQCIVTPVYCEKNICNELMFVHATSAYPRNFFWIKQNHHYTCSREEEKNTARLIPCNRVERLPLFAYLTSYQDGVYPHLTWHAILGLHIEKILFPH